MIEAGDIIVDFNQIGTLQEFGFVKRLILEFEEGAKEKRYASGEILDDLPVIFG